jgi:hypothetical protein
MIFLKSVLGGIAGVVAMWIVIICISTWRMTALRTTGLTAVAGGWSYLLQMRWVEILLTAAFGIGLYLTAHWTSN